MNNPQPLTVQLKGIMLGATGNQQIITLSSFDKQWMVKINLKIKNNHATPNDMNTFVCTFVIIQYDIKPIAYNVKYYSIKCFFIKSNTRFISVTQAN